MGELGRGVGRQVSPIKTLHGESVTDGRPLAPPPKEWLCRYPTSPPPVRRLPIRLIDVDDQRRGLGVYLSVTPMRTNSLLLPSLALLRPHSHLPLVPRL